jgi:hypothetical protein
VKTEDDKDFLWAALTTICENPHSDKVWPFYVKFLHEVPIETVEQIDLFEQKKQIHFGEFRRQVRPLRHVKNWRKRNMHLLKLTSREAEPKNISASIKKIIWFSSGQFSSQLVRTWLKDVRWFFPRVFWGGKEHRSFFTRCFPRCRKDTEVFSPSVGNKD